MSARATRSAEPTLVETKLQPARTRPENLFRRRLLVELDRLAPAALTLIDAPVGFGKTVLAQSWCTQTDTAVAWVSLERGDDDPARLWTYIAASVDRIRPGLGRLALVRLRTPGVPATAAVDELLNGIAAYGESLAIVLDDLHVIGGDESLRSLEHALEHLPSNARVIVTTRSDPALPLGRLRARGALGELRARDLAFTVDEARAMLVGREGIALDENGVKLLVERTEGWPAGLYLAALWLRGVDDPGARVRDFHGDHRHVVEYLTGEVLDALDENTRRFLLESSVLGHFDAELCDAVLGRADSAERLREIEQANGFLVRLDGRRGWYRYHHLFGELLQLELANGDRLAPTRLRLAASDWHREHGLVHEALEHASAAPDERRIAAILLEQHRDLLRSGEAETFLRWSGALPDELLLESPDLALSAALACGMVGRSGHERRRFVAMAERIRAARPESWGPYHDTALGIATMTWVEADLGAAIALGRRAADLTRLASTELTAPALASLGFLLFLAGDLEGARGLSEEALDLPEIAARPHGLVFARATLSLLLTETGDLAEAETEARQALDDAREAGIAEVTSGGLARIALASALAAQGTLAEAEREAEAGERLRRLPEPEAGHLHAQLVLAAIRARRGQLVRASADLDDIRRGLARFTDAGRLPALADEVERLVAKADASPVDEAPSTAELSVLRLLATDLTQREIGAQLYLSVNTVKTHSRALYRKLGVSSRAEAVTRASALGLLDGSESPG